MREIKFRGKSEDGSGWIFGSLVNNMFFKRDGISAINYIVDPDQYPDFSEMEDFEWLAVEVIPETVGQYTGLQDKSGKEIYEGDIVNVKYRTFSRESDCGFIHKRLEVKWIDYSSAFRYVDKFEEIYTMIAKWSEVIGNIHDNPELLEGER